MNSKVQFSTTSLSSFSYTFQKLHLMHNIKSANTQNLSLKIYFD